MTARSNHFKELEFLEDLNTYDTKHAHKSCDFITILCRVFHWE